MILEHALLSVKLGEEMAFEAAFARAKPIIAGAPGFRVTCSLTSPRIILRTVATRRPDRTPTTDLARCHATHASSNQPGAGPLAAVDGSPATDWRPTQLPASLTVALAHQQTISTATS